MSKKAKKSAKRTAKRTKPTEEKKVKSAKRSKSAKKATKKFPSKLIPLKQIDKKTLALIAEADKHEAIYMDSLDKFRETLDKILVGLGGSSFQHPDRGPMSIMVRGYTFWRKKPSGK